MFVLKKDGLFHHINTKINNNNYYTPMITDSHLHIIGLGEKLTNPYLEFKNNNEIENIIRNQLINKPSKIILRGYSEETSNINKKFLDEISKNIPILLVRRCGHVGTCNSFVLENLNFENFNHLVDFEKGVLEENALSVFYNIYGHHSNIKKSFKTAEEFLLKLGYGYIHSDDLHNILFNDIPFNEANIQIFEKVSIYSLKELYEKEKEGYFNLFNCVKVFVDGSFGGRTAYLKDAYNDDKENYGKLLWEKSDFEELMTYCSINNLHLAIHCIGDAGIDFIINSYKNTNPNNTIRIIHSAILHDYQLDFIKENDIILDMQPSFIESDEPILESRLGKRIDITYRFYEIYKRKINLFLSSDAPIEDLVWWEYMSILKNQNIPLSYSLYLMTYAPEYIDGWDRETDIDTKHLIFENNPFEFFNSKPKIFFNK